MAKKRRRPHMRKQGISFHSIALRILENEGRPMTIKELTKMILEEKNVSGKTPASTLSSVLQRSRYVQRVGKGKYMLIKKN